MGDTKHNPDPGPGIALDFGCTHDPCVCRDVHNTYHSYVRELEDAALLLWQELPTEQSIELREEVPRLMDFMAHLHHRIEHEQAMVRVNVWCDPNPVSGEVMPGGDA